MPRKKGQKPLGHKPGGKKRPRAWHHGRGAGRQDAHKLALVEPAFVAAEADRVAVAARTVSHMADVADWQDCLAQLDRVSPAAPAPFPALFG